MMQEKQKNMISYQRYYAKKSKEPDHLCNMILKNKQASLLQSQQSNDQRDPAIKSQLMQRRIEQIKKIHKYTKVSKPQPFKKRTWISPLVASQKSEEILFYSWKKPTISHDAPASDKQRIQNVCNVLNLNKKMHLFGEFLYCEFQGKENDGKLGKVRGKVKVMDVMHKEYGKLMNSTKKSIVVCSKDSILNRKAFSNPLENDKYFQKIMRYNDIQLMQLLIRSLNKSGPFTFTSYIKFYELFIWQQSSKQLQLEFVLNLLMGSSNIISYKNLSQMIDFMCLKISLQQQKQYLNGFNQVMKKLIFASQYQQCCSLESFMTRDSLMQSLLINEECISIFINVFYAQ